MEYPLKKPGEKGPDGVAGGMGTPRKSEATMSSPVFETNGGLEGEGVND